MSFTVQHKRSGELGRRPQPLDLAPGQLAVNYNTETPGLFFRTDTGDLIKVGPTHIGPRAPAQTNYNERSDGEMWLDTSDLAAPCLKVYTPNGWKVVNVLDRSITTDKIADGAVTARKFRFNNSLFPTVNSEFDIGTSSVRLNTLYTQQVNVSTSIIPDEDLGANVGSPNRRFSNVYTGDLHLKNDRGDWTIVEEEEYLTLRNNKTGRRFKISMEPLD